MFNTIEEALVVYKKELREYLKKIEELKTNKYGGNEDVLGCWDEVDCNYAVNGTNALKTVERVLGLSQGEVERIETEVKSSL